MNEKECLDELVRRKIINKGLKGYDPDHAACVLFTQHKMGVVWSLGGYTVQLYKKQWKNKINLEVLAMDYGHLVKDLPKKEKKKINNIFGMGGRSFPLAVFRCLLNARAAGVI
jgi:hypothetical protein